MSARASSDQSILRATFLRIKREVAGGQPELGEYFLDGDPFSAAFAEPGLGAGECLPLLVRDRLIVVGRFGKGAGKRILQHVLKNTDYSGKLRGLQPFDQLMRLLFFGDRVHFRMLARFSR